MINRTFWRSYSLAIISIGINLTVVYTLLVPDVGNRRVADFKFPDQIPVKEGMTMVQTSMSKTNSAIANTSSLNTEKQPEVIKTRQQYQYRHNGREINLEISYLVGTRGDIGAYLQNYTAVEEEVIKQKSIKQLPGIGYHALFTDRNQTYLTSCISPRSPSNVTQKQFSQNRYQHDLQWQVGLDWLKGNASIRDRRCLWVLLSTANTTRDSQAAAQALAGVWQDLYPWLLTNFPPLTNQQ